LRVTCVLLRYRAHNRVKLRRKYRIAIHRKNTQNHLELAINKLSRTTTQFALDQVKQGYSYLIFRKDSEQINYFFAVK
jgi:hypothetical protein